MRFHHSGMLAQLKANTIVEYRAAPYYPLQLGSFTSDQTLLPLLVGTPSTLMLRCNSIFKFSSKYKVGEWDVLPMLPHSTWQEESTTHCMPRLSRLPYAATCIRMINRGVIGCLYVFETGHGERNQSWLVGWVSSIFWRACMSKHSWTRLYRNARIGRFSGTGVLRVFSFSGDATWLCPVDSAHIS
jgi:hypothetical protein